MQNKEKELLVGAMEQCGKITQFCSKALKFGLFSHHPNSRKTNGDEILTKYYRLQGIIEELQRNRVLPTYNNDYINRIKHDAVVNVKSPKKFKNK